MEVNNQQIISTRRQQNRARGHVICNLLCRHEPVNMTTCIYHNITPPNTNLGDSDTETDIICPI